MDYKKQQENVSSKEQETYRHITAEEFSRLDLAAYQLFLVQARNRT